MEGSQVLSPSKIRTGGKPFGCDRCPRKFSKQKQLEIHVGSKACKNTSRCDVCGKSFLLQKHLALHMRFHTHSRIHSPNVDDCVKIHASEKPFACFECSKSFSSKHDLVRHMKDSHMPSIEREPCICDNCNTGFVDAKTRDDHMKKHTTSIHKLKRTCVVCNKAFKTIAYRNEHMLNWHMPLIHNGENPYSCYQCLKSYPVKMSFLQHLKSCLSGGKQFVCGLCSRAFLYKSALVNHVRVHTGEKPFTCSVCNKSFAQSQTLNKHKKIHTSEKPFACSECNKKFRNKNELLQHERYHAKPFVCAQCGKMFSRKSYLDNHVILHAGVKPFACTECSRAFSHKSSLNAHKKLHTGKIVCMDCNKLFANKTNLIRHTRIHTGGKHARGVTSNSGINVP